MTGQSHVRYLEELLKAIRMVQAQGDAIGTLAFCEFCDRVLAALDHLGPVLYFAKMEMGGKVDSLKKAGGHIATLREVVDADVKAKRATVKNSCARNLHRLMLVVSFVRLMLSNLLENPNLQLKDAMWTAYQGSLGPIHTYMLRTAVWAGLAMVPSRAAFLKSIGETEESAREHVPEVLASSTQVVTRVESLFSGVKMPNSEVTYVPLGPPSAAVAAQ